ncbi:MAG: methenyltetrahydromethanopterin cyclohydrolase [Archaeoglobi archaeon]|nr:methenyltetrahydromethanopterin cyclohydrolase [Archaeoglobi archaeon]MDK2781420.1 methenyltetrahydromethanopterin cyclohydrolase [Archaeoglobi archaeon]
MMNERAASVIEEELIGDEDVLKIRILERGRHLVLDFGVNVPGSYEAGLIFTEICMGCLGSATLTFKSLGDFQIPFIEVFTDFPVEACMLSQMAGWRVKKEGYFAMASGPARALARIPSELFREFEYEESSDVAVIALESSKLPPEDVLDFIAEKCGAERVYALVAPTSSLVGSIQISGRVAETAIHRIHSLGMDLRNIISCSGTAPVAPIAEDELKAMGRTNDCIIYHGSVSMIVEDMMELSNAVSSSSPSFGKPFYELFRESNFDFYKLDPALFAPAEISVNSRKTGEFRKFGRVHPEILLKSFGYEKIS